MSLPVLFPRKEYDTIAERYAAWQAELRLRETGEIYYYDEDEPARDVVEEIDSERVLVVLDPITTIEVATETLRNERRPLSYLVPPPIPQPPAPILQHIPTTARSILHVGSGDGSLGAAVKQRQRCRVVGIAAKRSAAKLDDVYVGDYVTIIDILDESFDCIIVTGVLEHVIDPWSLLMNLRRLGKTLVALIPNIANEATIAGLREGRFPVAAQLRFFTRESIVEMLEIAGWKLERLEAPSDQALIAVAG
ncbi:MAG TPA: methyltransferase domain-containing protein [Thermoanaerobaculia bacterium]|nr:methyltransferase domain-containing protein [Thermoanaerobaculia bacterium]